MKVLQQTMNNAAVAAIALLSLAGCSDSDGKDDGKSPTAAKTASGNSKSGDSSTAGNDQKAIEAMSLRLVGDWTGDSIIVDPAALRRFAENAITSTNFPDPAKRSKAVDEFVSSQSALYKGMKHTLVINKDGTYAKTSWGTGAYSDGKPQKGAWKITKSTGSSADVSLTVSGRSIPYVVKFRDDGKITLHVSETMPRYSDANRALAERYARKKKSDGKASQ